MTAPEEKPTIVERMEVIVSEMLTRHPDVYWDEWPSRLRALAAELQGIADCLRSGIEQTDHSLEDIMRWEADRIAPERGQP